MPTIELLSLIPALSGARRLPAEPPLTAATMVAGIEIATTTAAPDRTLRRFWRERRGGGATPLLLVTEDASRPGSFRVLGPVDEAGPIRSIRSDALHAAIQRVSSRPRLEAIRELISELDRLDQAGIPGLKLRELLTLHTLDVRLRRDPARWQRAAQAVNGVPGGADWRGVLTALGYTLERRHHRGYLARFEHRPIAVIHPKADPAEFARLDQDGRPPEGMLLNDCQADGAPFGILAYGPRLRLFKADTVMGPAVARYLDLDASTLQEDDWPFLALLSPEFLAEGQFTVLQDEARSFGAALRMRLDQTIRQTALPALGRALGRWARDANMDLASDAVREELERAALTLVFRLVFLLYAEAAGYLPMENHSYRQASLSSLVDEAEETQDRLSGQSTSLGDRLALLVKAMRTGNPAWGVPAYNGALFSADGFDGAAILEQAELPDPDVALILIGIGRDTESGQGVDYSTLEIGHLGHIYEGLLSLRLSLADAALRYDPRRDRYTAPVPGEPAEVEAGDLLWQTHEGGRKGGGVYYTRSELVSHLVRETVLPSFEAHLRRVKARATTEPVSAEQLFDFAVLDPACGSAHFLVTVVNELADRMVRFLGDTPVPEVRTTLERLRAGASAAALIDDVALLRRAVLKRCVYGVDVSPMGAEVAKLSLWLASFAPGLSLAYLDRNIVVGNSLLGVMRPESLLRAGKADQASWLDQVLPEALARAAEAVTRVAASDDRSPTEVEASAAADVEAHQATAALERLYHLWTAEPFGVAGARHYVEALAPQILEGHDSDLTRQAVKLAAEHRFLHWPLAFPRVFIRDRPGFDCVVGNPPWNEVTIEEQSFYALFRPGIRRGISEADRAAAVKMLIAERPELPARLAAEQERIQVERVALAAGEYMPMRGDPDLYKFFCQRYRGLLRDDGALGVVLPRTTFVNKGSQEFRSWLFEQITCNRIDFLINRNKWAFDTHPQYTVALVDAVKRLPEADHRVHLAGPAKSLADWNTQANSAGLALLPEAFGPDWAPPLLGTQEEADLLAKIRHGSRFPYGSGGRWRCFPVAELHETHDRHLWQAARQGLPLWKGESFDQYEPDGQGARICPSSSAVLAKVRKPQPGMGSILSAEVPLAARRAAVLHELDHARIAFHDVTQKDNSRTVVACLIPPQVFLTNSAPYLAFTAGNDRDRAACLGIMNSLPFDWQARRFAEVHVNFFILEGLVVPDLADEDLEVIARAAARLSCVDDRFAEFAQSTGVETGPLDDEEHERLRVEIDARVARAWGLTAADLGVLFADFSLGAVPATYRQDFAARLAELC